MPQNSPWNDTQFVLAATLVVVLLVTLVLAVEGGMLGEFRFFPKGRFAISPEKPSQVQIIQPSQIQSVSIQPNENIYVYGAGKVAQLQSTGIKYFHNDYLGTPRVETNANKNIVASNNQYPFGEVLSSAGNERYRFTGKESDDSGLMYFGARFYDSSAGRFTQVDPAGVGYVYANNNPLKFIDPEGNDPENAQQNSHFLTDEKEKAYQRKRTINFIVTGCVGLATGCALAFFPPASISVAMAVGAGEGVVSTVITDLIAEGKVDATTAGEGTSQNLNANFVQFL